MALDLDAVVAEFFSIILALPSVALYLLQCAIIIRHWKKDFNGSFFKLFLVSALNNLLLNFVCSFFFVRLPNVPQLAAFFVSMPRWMSTFFFGIQLYQVHVDNLLTMFILLQRLFVILFPFDSEKIWKWLFPFAVFVSFCLPLVIISNVFGLSIGFAVYDADQSVHFQQIHKDPSIKYPNNSLILLYSCAITMLICICINCAILTAFRRESKRNGDAGQQGNVRRIETRLMFYAFTIFGAQLIVAIFQLTMFLSTNIDTVRAHVMNQYVWVNDIRALVVPTWFLLWASFDVRTRVKAMVCWPFWSNATKLSKTPNVIKIMPAAGGGKGGTQEKRCELPKVA